MKNSKLQMWEKINVYGKKIAFVAGIVAIISAVTDWGYIFLLNKVYSAVGKGEFGIELLIVFSLLGIVIAVAEVLNGLINIVITKELCLIEKGYQEYVFSIVKKITPYQFEEPRTLELVQSVKTNKEGIIMYFHDYIMMLLNEIPYFIGLLIFLWTIYPALMVVMLITFFPSILSWKMRSKFSYQVSKKSGEYQRRINAYRSYLLNTSWLQETRFYGMQNRIRDLYSNSLSSLKEEKIRYAYKRVGIDCVAAIFYIFGMLIVFFSLFIFSKNGLINGAEVATALTILISIYDKMNSLMYEKVATIVENAAKIDLLCELDELAKKNEEKTEYKKNIETISFNEISFRYPDGRQNAVSSASLEVESGKVVAIVGENGSGKTTLSKIISGVYSPQEGKVYVNGSIISDYESYSNKVSVVWQDYNKYPLTIAENILLSDCSREKEECVNSILSKVELEKLTIKKNDILSKEFGGIELSGGEWQRVAIGRAIAKKADVVVFDEPTAAIDPMEEVNIMKLLLSLCQNKIAILVTHRIGAARLADSILVMKKGRIIEKGTHDELMKIGGEYYRMYTAQKETYKL